MQLSRSQATLQSSASFSSRHKQLFPLRHVLAVRKETPCVERQPDCPIWGVPAPRGPPGLAGGGARGDPCAGCLPPAAPEVSSRVQHGPHPFTMGSGPKGKALVRAGLGGEGLRHDPCVAAVGYLPTPCSDAHRVLES